jgi:hypothetical protein
MLISNLLIWVRKNVPKNSYMQQFEYFFAYTFYTENFFKHTLTNSISD